MSLLLEYARTVAYPLEQDADLDAADAAALTNHEIDFRLRELLFDIHRDGRRLVDEPRINTHHETDLWLGACAVYTIRAFTLPYGVDA